MPAEEGTENKEEGADVIETIQELSSLPRHWMDVTADASLSCSTAKAGNGPELLLDGNVETFWQSDAQLPHTITLEFQRRMKLKSLCLYISLAEDDSYTPLAFSIRFGTYRDCLQLLRGVNLDCPNGWVVVPLVDPNLADVTDTTLNTRDAPPLRTHILEVVITKNAQTGKDCHVRQISVYAEADLQRHAPTVHSSSEAMGFLENFGSADAQHNSPAQLMKAGPSVPPRTVFSLC
eukprot:CAMPEP_0113892426 /NCGR_PEP_ID=MMETSP0780_2-20120614/15409_1 /TAXON_ID=652834 /ORGANISM="Palpitomonas bilix" /LENGTH=234 /DNA_ID=CAMNT_0000882361 /DNA_START=110 /DNA_END=815 /DNA_ORIENTATION=- /assembly_acc=CAM_ASM_000599